MTTTDAVLYAFAYLAYIALIICFPYILRRIFPKRKKRGKQ